MKIVLVRANDWEGLYFDGLLLVQDHSIDVARVVELAGGTVKHLTSDQDRHLCEIGQLPDTLSEVEEL